jgi:hypothetical protein
MEAVHRVSNGSQSNDHHKRKDKDSAVYLLKKKKKNASCMMLNLVATQKNYERLCQEGKACNTERNVIKSE